MKKSVLRIWVFVIVCVILSGCSTSPETIRYKPPIDTNAYNLYTDGTNIDMFSEQDIIAMHYELVEYRLLKKDYYMLMEENNIFKLRIGYLEKNYDSWYDNAVVGFILGIGTAIFCVWGAGQLQ